MIYRNSLSMADSQFKIQYKYSNILVKFVGGEVDSRILYDKLYSVLVSLYKNLERFISNNESFKTSLTPWYDDLSDSLAVRMAKYTKEANVGPMASVAGVFADEILAEAEKYAEVVFIENGGDIALKNVTDSYIKAYHGNNGLQREAILKLPPGTWGVASSSGKFGHSYSFGQADLISVVAENANRADSFATSIANQIIPGCDPLQLLKMYNDLNAVLIIWNDNIWYKGDFELTFE